MLRKALQVCIAPTRRRRLSTRPYYITTPIFYPNSVPHIGHLHSLVIADIFARYQRVLNPSIPVIFLAGTDEHGLKIQKAAQAKALPASELCDQLSQQFRNLGETAHITNTIFMRTSQPTHRATVEDVWQQLDSKGLIYKGKYSGWYSITDESFYTEAQITPSYQNPQVMISTETGAVVEWIDEENYMFRLASFREALHSYYSAPESSQSIFPPQHHAHILQILSGPLEDLSISRPRSRLQWGIQVPGDPTQTIYVWFDALLVYLSGIGYPWEGIQSQNNGGWAVGWPVSLQIIGKDILRFHAIYLPAILKALGLPLQLRLLAHAHWTVEQKKMSKSLGNVADPFEAIQEFGVDIVRYYLARVGGRFRDDVDWSQTQLHKYSKELQSLLGNFLLRISSSKIQTRIDGHTQPTHSPATTNLLSASLSLATAVEDSLTRLEISEALEHVVDVLRLANKTFTDVSPWKRDCPVERVLACYLASHEALRTSGICLQPFVPDVSLRLLDALGIPSTERAWTYAKSPAKTNGMPSIRSIKLF